MMKLVLPSLLECTTQGFTTQVREKKRFPPAAVKRKIPPSSGEDKLLGYPALVSILKLKPDYFVGTGDNVYYDGPFVGRAETQQQIRRKYQEQFSQPRFFDLFQQVATYWMKDDHDFRFNDSDPNKPLPCGAQL